MESSEEKKTSTPSPLSLDWNNVEALSQYVTGTGRILPRKYTGLSARQQRHIARMIKRARCMLLMK
ncbi:MAG: 30S ribosomal protein S18 [Verrucomicrobiota bacterium]|nr:30S ribosomal protein S18 [Opitutales bacterium]UPA28302.1 MAG: 30S ribosomal protein S18 [Verrucomicrobiota bacterium]